MARPDRPAQPLVLTLAQTTALTATIARFGGPGRVRGERYFRQHRVLEILWDGTSAHAQVEGNEYYNTLWTWMGDAWDCECSCPVGYRCKHSYAMAREILESCAIIETPGAGGQRAPVAPPPTATLATVFANNRDSWSRHGILRRLLAKPEFRNVSSYDPVFEELFGEPDPELLCFQLAREIAARTGGQVPAELAPYVESRDLAQRQGMREQAQLATELIEWAGSRKKPAPRSLRFVWNLTQGLTGRLALAASARLTTTRLNDEPRSHDQLRLLLSEAQRKPGALAADQYLFLSAFIDATSRYSAGFWSTPPAFHPAVAIEMLKAVDDSHALLTWATDIDPAVASRAGITAGAALRLARLPIRVLPAAVESSGGARLQLHCLWPDGSQRAVADVLYFPSVNRGPAVVIADGCFLPVVEEPPEELRNRFLALGGLDLPRERCVEILAPLAQHFPHLRESLRAHIRYLAGNPIVALDLNEDDWLQIRVFVHSSDDDWSPDQEPVLDATVLEFSPHQRWQAYRPRHQPGGDRYDPIAAIVPESEGRVAASVGAEVADADVWMEEPHPETVAPALAWLQASGAEPGDKGRPGGNAPQSSERASGWWMQASARRMAHFAELWDARPIGVRFLGTERVRRLLSGAQVVRPKLQVKASGLDWFSVAAEWEAEGLALSDADMAKLRSSANRFVRLAGGWVRRDAVEAHDEAAGVLADLGVEIGGGEQRITLWQLAGAKPESVAALERMGASGEATRALAKLRLQLRKFKGVPATTVPRQIRAELRPYQRLGLDFLSYTASLGLGAVLADDMGLGKTLQALAWLQQLIQSDRNGGPSLVVCPTSVMHNWMREAAQFAPKLRVLMLERGAARHQLRKQIGAYDLVITNYALLRRDLDQWKELELRAAILDEAQNIKNPDAAVSHAAFELRASHRLALTGTPLENRPLDLWSITNFVNPGYLGGRSDFGVRFDRIDGSPHARTLLAAKLRPILLRRLKREVAADLPDRIEERRDCELTDGQRQLYLAELRRSRKLVDELSEDDGALRKNKITILAALTRLRQICCHPALAKGKASLGSGKFDALFELLEPLLAEGHKVLLFSQFVQCLKLIEKEMAARAIAHHLLTGETVKREEVVRAFRADERAGVFLISLKAGGTGLNLTEASYVVLFDPWWNPAVEAQAIDRSHRIGQDQTVIAYRMIARGTIEEKIWELQQRKAEMVRDILGEQGFARALSRDDLSFLLQDVP